MVKLRCSFVQWEMSIGESRRVTILQDPTTKTDPIFIAFPPFIKEQVLQ